MSKVKVNISLILRNKLGTPLEIAKKFCCNSSSNFRVKKSLKVNSIVVLTFHIYKLDNKWVLFNLRLVKTINNE